MSPSSIVATLSGCRLAMAPLRVPRCLSLQPRLPATRSVALGLRMTYRPQSAAAATRSYAQSSSGLVTSSSSSSSGSSGSSGSDRLWCLAAAVPFITISSNEAQDPSPVLTTPHSHGTGFQLPIHETVIRQVSMGSFVGFAMGLLVSMFSRTLVLLLGVALSVQSLLQRVGIDLVAIFHLRDRMRASKILSALTENTALKLSWAIAFTLSAFMRF